MLRSSKHKAPSIRDLQLCLLLIATAVAAAVAAVPSPAGPASAAVVQPISSSPAAQPNTTRHHPGHNRNGTRDHNSTRTFIVTIGDSLTRYGYKDQQDGWAALLQRDYPQHTLLNKGRMHGTAATGVRLANNMTGPEPKPEALRRPGSMQLVTLWFGANDAGDPRKLAKFAPNLRETIQLLQAAGAKRFLLLTPPPQSPARRDNSRVAAALEQHAEAVRALGKELGVPVADVFRDVQAVTGWETSALLPDGLHLAPGGQQVVYRSVRAALKQHFPDL